MKNRLNRCKIFAQVKRQQNMTSFLPQSKRFIASTRYSHHTPSWKRKSRRLSVELLRAHGLQFLVCLRSLSVRDAPYEKTHLLRREEIAIQPCYCLIRFSNHTGPPHLPVTTMSRSPSASRSDTRRLRPEPIPCAKEIVWRVHVTLGDCCSSYQ